MSRIASCLGSPMPTNMAAAQVSAWQQDRLSWQDKQPVTAALAEQLEIVAVESTQLATMTTDGRRLLINPEWSATLEAKQRRQAQEHLVWHAAAGDYRPPADKLTHRWHLACDHTINAQLLQLGVELPVDAVLFLAAMTWQREEVYAWLGGHPWLEGEQPPDQFCWQPDNALSFSQIGATELEWQQHIRATVKHFLGTPWLPDTVAAWLLGRR